ncbi:MAG: GAF domain-containing protein [Pyrinomonadaceae bacterium]
MKIEEELDLPELFETMVRTNEITRVLNFDLDRSLDEILKTAAAQLNSEEASILVRDTSGGDLFFLKAIGTVGSELEGVRVPAGKGIAGFVAASGQPMAVGETASDETFYAEIDKQTGFSTEILLATPLFFDGEIIGVLEFVNRIGDPPYEPFTPEEMDIAAIYGQSISGVVNAYLANRLSTEFAVQLCKDRRKPGLQEQFQRIMMLRGKKEHKDLLELALLVKELADRGESERRLCRDLLRSLIDYSNQMDRLQLRNA